MTDPIQRTQLGDRVRVQFLALIQDGTDAEQPRGRKVLHFRAGSTRVMSGISLGVVGMASGEKKRLTLQPSEAYGEVRRELIREIPRSSFPVGLRLCVGGRIAWRKRSSNRRQVFRVVDLNAVNAVLDGNHPWAGKTLEVEIQVVSLDTVAFDGPGSSDSAQNLG